VNDCENAWVKDPENPQLAQSKQVRRVRFANSLINSRLAEEVQQSAAFEITIVVTRILPELLVDAFSPLR
jgi:hypothetical protein